MIYFLTGDQFWTSFTLLVKSVDTIIFILRPADMTDIKYLLAMLNIYNEF